MAKSKQKRALVRPIRHLLSPYLPKNSHTALNVSDLIKLVSTFQSRSGFVRRTGLDKCSWEDDYCDRRIIANSRSTEGDCACATNNR